LKLVILVRHATAADRDIDLPDFDRTLVKKGKKESTKMAKIFHSYQIVPDIWVSSPAPRALETAQIFAKIFNIPATKILQEEKLYTDNSAGAYMGVIHTMPSDQKSVIFFGHDPSISDFAALLVGNFEISFQKAGVVMIVLLAESWQQIKAGEGYLTAAEFPKSDRRIRQLLSKNLDRLITVHNQRLISTIFPRYQNKILKMMKDLTGKIVKKIVKIIRDK
jgi:phosphohistidine phosphatase